MSVLSVTRLCVWDISVCQHVCVCDWVGRTTKSSPFCCFCCCSFTAATAGVSPPLLLLPPLSICVCHRFCHHHHHNNNNHNNRSAKGEVAKQPTLNQIKQQRISERQIGLDAAAAPPTPAPAAPAGMAAGQ